MTTFDGSTTGATRPAPEPDPDVEDTGVGVSALELLRARVAEAAEVREDWVHEIRRTGVRITCDTNIEASDQQRWMSSALPRTKRGSRQAPDITKLRREIMGARAIIGSCTQIELRGHDEQYRVVKDPTSGEPLVLDSPELLRSFGVPDPVELLRKLFVRDADMMNAGEDLLTAAGFLGGDDGDEVDPT